MADDDGACVEDHLGILGKIVEVAETEEDTDKLVDDATVDQLYKLLNGLEWIGHDNEAGFLDGLPGFLGAVGDGHMAADGHGRNSTCRRSATTKSWSGS